MTDRKPQRNNPKYAYQKRRQKRRRKYLFFNFILVCLGAACLVLLLLDYFQIQPGTIAADIADSSPLPSPILTGDIPPELAELLELNEETRDFVKEYPNRDSYLSREIDLASDRGVTDALAAGRVPLLMQWDLRWGYAPYGDDMIGLAGCGPVCLSMACVYLTGDTSLHPAAMSEFAEKNGFYSKYGTDWALWTDGVSLLGLSGETLTLSESAMKSTLDSGGLIICSMRPGDFTTTGHFILIRGYDGNGFYVNDPNRHSNSDRQWSYDELSRQIKNLWGIWNPTSPG